MIVFDSSTLILLAKANLLDDFLSDYEGKVLIPQEVKVESCDRKDSLDALLIEKRVQEAKIVVAMITNSGICRRFMKDFRIGRGEAEALALFIEKKAKLLATDDKNAINACKLLKIPFASAITMLVRMAERGVIDADKAKIALNALIKYGRYSKAIGKAATERLETK